MISSIKLGSKPPRISPSGPLKCLCLLGPLPDSPASPRESEDIWVLRTPLNGKSRLIPEAPVCLQYPLSHPSKLLPVQNTSDRSVWSGSSRHPRLSFVCLSACHQLTKSSSTFLCVIIKTLDWLTNCFYCRVAL